MSTCRRGACSNSALADGASGVTNLSFGGNQGLSSSSRSFTSSYQNTLSWFDDANKHRLKLGTEASYTNNAQNLASNLLGTFTFNSLEDLEAGRAASFSRTLTARQRSTGQVSGAPSVGDPYRKTQDLQIQYGLRAEAAHFTVSPAYNAAVEQTFGRRNDHLPTPVAFSPRIGFSYTLGEVDEIASFFGQQRAPRAVVRGGIGVFSNASSAGTIGSALDNTGLPSGAQQVVCVGEAVPVVAWSAYASKRAMVPDRCADGTTAPYSRTTRRTCRSSPNFHPQQNIRSNLSWNGAILDARFTANIEGRTR